MFLIPHHKSFRDSLRSSQIRVRDLRSGYVSEGSTESTLTLGSFTVEDGDAKLMVKPGDLSGGELVWLKHQVTQKSDKMATDIGLGGIEVLCDVAFCKGAVDWFDAGPPKTAGGVYDIDETVEQLPDILENTMAPGEFDAFYDADDEIGGGDIGARDWGVERSLGEAWRSKISKNITHDISLFLDAPTLILHDQGSGSKVVLDMGKLNLTNKDADIRDGAKEVGDIMNREEVASDQWEGFVLKLTGFSILLDSGRETRALLSPATSLINLGVEKKTSSKGKIGRGAKR